MFDVGKVSAPIARVSFHPFNSSTATPTITARQVVSARIAPAAGKPFDQALEMPARVAGVPIPPEWLAKARVVIKAAFRSLSATKRLACSMADSNVASVNGFGGADTPSARKVSRTGRGPFPRESGIRFTGFFSASSFRDVPSIAVQPASTVTSLDADSGTRSVEPSA